MFTLENGLYGEENSLRTGATLPLNNNALEHLSDSEIIALILGGRRDLFALLVARYERLGFSLVTGFPMENAKDVLQESFLKAFRSLNTLKDRAAFKSWFLSIVRNQARNAAQKNSKREQKSIDQMAFEISDSNLELEEAEEREKLMAALRDIPEIYRDVLSLRFFHTKSYREIAEALNISEKNVDARLQRGAAMLRKLLEREALS